MPNGDASLSPGSPGHSLAAVAASGPLPFKLTEAIHHCRPVRRKIDVRARNQSSILRNRRHKMAGRQNRTRVDVNSASVMAEYTARHLETVSRRSDQDGNQRK
jgi:hypothetical protein